MLAGLLLALHFVHDGLSHPPNEHPSRWSESLTAEKMKGCVWLRPEDVAQIEFLEWIDTDRLRHAGLGSMAVGLGEREHGIGCCGVVHEARGAGA